MNSDVTAVAGNLPAIRLSEFVCVNVNMVWLACNPCTREWLFFNIYLTDSLSRHWGTRDSEHSLSQSEYLEIRLD